MKKVFKDDTGRVRVQTVMHGKQGRTQQQFKQDCDVNIIMDRIRKTGQMPAFQSKTGRYADISEYPDYQTALQTVINANTAFMELPSKLRRRFDNNPDKLIKFLADKNNDKEAIELGLVNKPAEVPLDPGVQAIKDLTEQVKGNTEAVKKSRKRTEED